MSMLSGPSRCDITPVSLAPSRPTSAMPTANSITPPPWIADPTSPYSPAHQVELQHLQAEADALWLQLRAIQHARGT